jgi:hypothetical protein
VINFNLNLPGGRIAFPLSRILRAQPGTPVPQTPEGDVLPPPSRVPNQGTPNIDSQPVVPPPPPTDAASAKGPSGVPRNPRLAALGKRVGKLVRALRQGQALSPAQIGIQGAGPQEAPPPPER